MAILDRFQQGDVRALSKVVSFVEDRQEGFRELLGQLYPRAGRALRIGVTGPPGAGKSTLVNSLVHKALDADKSVGIVAVDPTSPFTGGALLGDRVRINEFPNDGKVFFRSMATRGATGGLAEATSNVTVVYDAFGFDIILIETVGVGQVELDIIDACDVVVVVVVPESGDGVQTMKAGLMEIADIFCVNKADRPGAERIANDLKHALSMFQSDSQTWTVPVIPTIALKGENTDRLYDSVKEYVAHTRETGRFESHRRQQVERKIFTVLKSRLQEEFLERLGDDTLLDDMVEDILGGKTDPYKVCDDLFKRFAQQ